ncbi:MAG: hypothetical protein ACJAR3_001989 [Roseivirga sp.]|jgi:hypothetical protein
MKNIKITVTFRCDKKNATGNSDDDSRLELRIVRKHLKEIGPLNTYEAERLYGIRELRTAIGKLQYLIPIQAEWIISPHPQSGRLTKIKVYWLESHVIEALDSDELVEELAKHQQSAKIAKQRAKNIKTLEEMCSYLKRETLENRLNEIYGKLAANDD